jgi:transposase
MVNEWVAKYLKGGISALESKKPSGRPCLITEQQKVALRDYIEKQSHSCKGGRLNGEMLQSYIQQVFSVNYHQNSFIICSNHWVSVGRQVARNTLSNRQKFKKTLKKLQIETIKLIRGHIALDQVDFWFQDEAKIGQQNTTTRLWSMKGCRPRAVKQQQFDYAYLFGAVCPATGETEALIAPYVDKNIMTHHLKQISAKTKTGRHAEVIMDGAGWHQASLVDGIRNVSILKLPPYSPELNPIEQVWSWLRQHHLANRCFSGYDDIVEACTIAWNDFVSVPKRVTKMFSRDWLEVGKT